MTDIQVITYQEPSSKNYKRNENMSTIPNSDAKYSAEEGFDFCGHFLIVLSYLLLVLGFPFTLCCCIKVVQEYQRAVSWSFLPHSKRNVLLIMFFFKVIFRLGRILSGGAKGAGLFFILPCVDNGVYARVLSE